MILSKQTEAAFLNAPGKCPFCGSYHIDASAGDNDDPRFYYLTTTCADCGGKWEEEYKLNGISNVEPGKVMPPGTVELLALAFSQQLTLALTGSQMIKVIELNISETNPGVCHSHDFCDANVIMNNAFNDVMDRDPCLSEMNDDMNKQEDQDLDLWNKAWNMAKAGRFYYSYLINPLPFNLTHTFN